MERLFRSLKTEWVPTVGYMTIALAEQDIGRYLMQRCNWTGRISTTVSWRRLLRKKNSILCPGIVDHYIGLPQAEASLCRTAGRPSKTTSGEP